MIYILILISMAYQEQPGQAMHSIEFNSLANCQAAAKVVHQQRPTINTICAEKGTKFSPVKR